jgi:hypothetical protein
MTQQELRVPMKLGGNAGAYAIGSHLTDDTNDWEIESARMASIYQNSYLNIAATTASDSDGGCIYTPERSTSFQYEPARIYPFSAQDPVSQTAFVRFPPSIEMLQASPLNKRAWVLQEVALSRRTIHFTDDQMYWFCAVRRASEDGTLASEPRGAPPSGVLLGPPRLDSSLEAHNNRGHMYAIWWSLVEDYSSRTLTNSQDKMAALAGLTTFFQQKLGDEPLAGMWKAELRNSLCWKCNPRTVRSNTSFPGIPSFSWASIDGPIKRNCCVFPTEVPRERGDRDLEILDTDISWSGQPLTSWITGGNLVVRGLLVKIGFAASVQHQHCSAPCPSSLVRDKCLVGNFTFDRCSAASEGVVWCLAVRSKQRTLNFPPPQEAIYKWCHILVLESTGIKDDEYRRVGVGKVWDNSGVFDNMEPRTLSIV